MKKHLLITGAVMLLGKCTFAQIGKQVDTASQKETIKKMPMDTSGQDAGKIKNSKGGENSGKNTDVQKQKSPKPDSTTPRNRRKEE